MREMTVLANALTSDLDRFEAFRRDDRMGYFYIVEYTNGMIKIGSTRNPKVRMQGVHYAAKSYAAGAETRRVAISAPHSLFRASEARLHKQLAAFRIKGTELFRMPFDDALKHCNAYAVSKPHGLKIRVTEKQSTEEDARCRSAAHRLLGFLLTDNDLREMTSSQISTILRAVDRTIQIARTPKVLK